MRKLGILAAAAAAFAMAGSAQAASIINGSFESGIDVGSSFAEVNGGDSTSIQGWTVLGGGVDYIGSYWPASDGQRSVDLSGLQPGGVGQLLEGLVLGQTYLITFDLNGNKDGAPAVKTVKVGVGTSALSQNSFDFTSNVGGSALPWQSYSFSFVAADVSQFLSFESVGGTSFGAALDNVAIQSAVPEASTWATMLIGFGGIGAMMRRRQKAAAKLATA